ncbi:MAG TPA: prephenate dehydratase [Aggregatilineales bacterium]|jgi:prephenate dehydratase|nr:prephenate dehydratase [Aggregatilineales bacterium]HPV07070.1 prephenate dehydratase [Aggregatilineales bacterium]HQA67335.1 prephenate dehydratase [Aggregatilineales bacterium]HQE17030.1 prephenate dehydratase [Aggregatilineales bacterium]
MSEPPVRVAFQGERGAYSEMAVRGLLPHAEPVPYRTFDEVFTSVEAGDAALGLVPIENSLAGSIHRNYDLLLRHSLYIVGETQLHVEHCLIANPGTALDEIKVVRSHPQALAQCERRLTELGVRVEAAYDTAGSVRDLKASGDRHAAAIASRLAAEVYGMEILCEGLEDDGQNFTRFLLLAREPVTPTGESKTSIVFALQNQPGALFRALACFALRDVDLTKIESRPLPGMPWKYRFYLDFLGSQHDDAPRRALAHLAEITTELRVLGSYPRGV